MGHWQREKGEVDAVTVQRTAEDVYEGTYWVI